MTLTTNARACNESAIQPRHSRLKSREEVTDGEAGEHGGSGDAPLDLGHLADLLFQGHPREQVGDSILNVRVGGLVHALRFLN